jgi:hypothetical protein
MKELANGSNFHGAYLNPAMGTATFATFLGVAELAAVVNAPFRGLLGTVSSNLPQLKRGITG